MFFFHFLSGVDLTMFSLFNLFSFTNGLQATHLCVCFFHLSSVNTMHLVQEWRFLSKSPVRNSSPCPTATTSWKPHPPFWLILLISIHLPLDTHGCYFFKFSSIIWFSIVLVFHCRRQRLSSSTTHPHAHAHRVSQFPPAVGE